MAARKKTYMPEKDIQRYEYLTIEQLAPFFSAEGAEHFMRLLRSYRIAANVACTAWKLLEELDRGTVNPETVTALRERLHLFAPEVALFKPAKPLLEHGCRVLEEVYDCLAAWTAGPYDASTLLEWLFERIEGMRRALRE